jgi:signal transduction histidine kinase
MAEVGNMGLPPKLLEQGVTDMVRVSDARMSGTAYGTVVLHVAPEAAAGGPLAAVRTGDWIELDCDAGRLHLDISDEELARRLSDVDPLAAPVTVEGDGPKLLLALVNLARNGIEAMGPGAFGEPLGERGPARPRRLDLGARVELGRLLLEVADRGPGLPAEVRRRLFEPFVTTKRSGTGLGLAIVWKVIEAHGGWVGARDREGGGTVFRVVLPAKWEGP